MGLSKESLKEVKSFENREIAIFKCSFTTPVFINSDVYSSIFLPIPDTVEINSLNFSNQFSNGIVKETGNYSRYEIIAQVNGNTNDGNRSIPFSRIIHVDEFSTLKNVSFEHREYTRNTGYDDYSSTIVMVVDDFEINDSIFLEFRVGSASDNAFIENVEFIIKEV